MRAANVSGLAANSRTHKRKVTYLFQLDTSNMDKQECRMRKRIFFQLLKQHLPNIMGGSILASVGIAVTIASLFCLKPLSWDDDLCWSRSRAEVIARATTDSVSTLALVHFIYFLRYPGPFLTGIGLFFNIMVILYLLWQTDIKIKQTYVRKPKMDVYERGLVKWKRDHESLWDSYCADLTNKEKLRRRELEELRDQSAGHRDVGEGLLDNSLSDQPDDNNARQNDSSGRRDQLRQAAENVLLRTPIRSKSSCGSLSFSADEHEKSLEATC
ncbi:uncharacterized protein LOC134839247 isoform X2 [Symsagittifera roscoffensis]|uniref:uncharacterized protein LOC134839247 isoform X2 n=1 Tax=Symsagittifera roscoffensis TaxID=84072 RepID=UPI00307C060C